ncbi:DNA-(apurinic or apyrimidinic site) lyase [Arachis hypogaea]|nr:DNA-(apurinic or apyrimidinic site) lyase [Arachis hypogaea]
MVCGHGERPILRTSMTKDNPGRRFWDCVYYEVQDGCDFFRWADPEARGALGILRLQDAGKRLQR